MVQSRSYFQPEQPPPVLDPKFSSFAQWVTRMFDVVMRRLNSPSELRLEPRHAEPDRPRVGMIVYADGTDWNPGAGEGIYYYKSTLVWTLLG